MIFHFIFRFYVLGARPFFATSALPFLLFCYFSFPLLMLMFLFFLLCPRSPYYFLPFARVCCIVSYIINVSTFLAYCWCSLSFYVSFFVNFFWLICCFRTCWLNACTEVFTSTFRLRVSWVSSQLFSPTLTPLFLSIFHACWHKYASPSPLILSPRCPPWSRCW